jgi:hypothetical protein
MLAGWWQIRTFVRLHEEWIHRTETCYSGKRNICKSEKSVSLRGPYFILFYNNRFSPPSPPLTPQLRRSCSRSVRLVGWVTALSEPTGSFRISSAVCNHNQSWTVLWFSDTCVSCSCLSKSLHWALETLSTVSAMCLTFFRVNVTACC